MKKRLFLIGVAALVNGGDAAAKPTITQNGAWGMKPCTWAKNNGLGGYCTRLGRWKEPLGGGYFNAYFNNGDKLVNAKVFDADLNTATGSDDDQSSALDDDEEIDAALQDPQ